MAQEYPWSPFSPDTTLHHNPPNNDDDAVVDAFGVYKPVQINPETLITPATNWPLWAGVTNGNFGITSTISPTKEFQFNITNESDHYKIIPDPKESPDEARGCC